MAEVSKFLIDKLNNLEIKCKYWYNGCEKIAKLPQIAAHERKCEKIPEKSFNDQEDLLFECPQGCQKLCSLPEIKGKHNCVTHLLEKIAQLDQQYSELFKENVALGKQNDEIEGILTTKQKELADSIEKNQELEGIFDDLREEREQKTKELSKFTLENMEETYSRIQENFGENLLKYPFTKAQHEELFKEFAGKINKEMNNLIVEGERQQREMLEGLKKGLMKSLAN